MDIRGLIPFSMLDFPGKLSAVVFVGGCNLACPFCHNPCLVLDPTSQPRIAEDELFRFLSTRVGKLDGVVVSGGEPTIYCDLPDVLRRMKGMGFAVKLDTNGTFPVKIRDLLENNLLDAVAIDYKVPKEKYNMLCVDGDCAEDVVESLRLALAAGVPCDVRTTVHRALLTPEDLRKMAAELTALGVTSWYLQQFNQVETLDEQLQFLPTYTDRELFDLSKELGPIAHVRGLRGKEFVK